MQCGGAEVIPIELLLSIWSHVTFTERLAKRIKLSKTSFRANDQIGLVKQMH